MHRHVTRAALVGVALPLVLTFGALPVSAATPTPSRVPSAWATATLDSADPTDAPGGTLGPDASIDLLAEVWELSAHLEAYQAVSYEYLYSRPMEEESSTVDDESVGADVSETAEAAPTEGSEGVTPVDPSGTAEGKE